MKTGILNVKFLIFDCLFRVNPGVRPFTFKKRVKVID